MKILVVHPSFHFYGGAEIAIVKLVNYLTAHKHTVDVLTIQVIPKVREDMNCNKIIFANSIDDMREKLNKIVIEYNVINFHNHPVELLLDMPYKSVWFCNEPPDVVLDGGKLSDNEKKKVLSTVSKCLVSDEKNAKRFEDVYGFKPTIIPYGTDYEFWSNDVEDRYRWENRNRFTILHSAVIHKRKGQLETLKMYVKLRDKIPNLKVIFAGLVADGQYFQEIVKYAKDNNVKNNDVIITGMLTREELRSLFHSVDVLVHPIGNQGGWLTPIDAMAAGLVTVTSDEANIAPIIKKNNIGFVCNTIDEYVDTILKVKELKGNTEMIGVAKEYVDKQLSWGKYCKAVMNELVKVGKR